MSVPDIVTIAGPDWSLDLCPEIGGALVAARARVGRDWHVITRPATSDDVAARDIRRLAGFPMVPYVNRLDGGRFVHDGREVKVRLNWPPDPTVAIHGIGWQRPWQIAERSATQLVLEQTVDDGADGYAYAARMVWDAAADWRLALSVENRAARRRPYGVGFHPYLRRAPGATLTFGATGRLEGDERVMPVAWVPLRHEDAVDGGRTVAAFDGIDASFTGWDRRMQLTLPDIGAALMLDCSAAGRLLHLYVPRGGDFLCVEPTSHVTDVANRRQFAPYGDMTALPPGEAMDMAISWRISPVGLQYR